MDSIIYSSNKSIFWNIFRSKQQQINTTLKGKRLLERKRLIGGMAPNGINNDDGFSLLAGIGALVWAFLLNEFFFSHRQVHSVSNNLQ